MSDAALDPALIARTLARHEVRYVLIGALAARLQGFPRVTADADITPSRDAENLERLAAALRVLDARVYTDTQPAGLAFDCSAKSLAQSQIWNLVSSAGRIDVVFVPAGTDGYDDLIEGAVAFEIFGVEVHASGLEDIIRSKEAADRPQDRQDIIVLRELLRRTTRS